MLDAVARALDAWGVTGTSTRLPGYEDDNFLVVGPLGRWVLKVSASDRPRHLLAAENEVLSRVAAAGIRCPEVVRTGDGEVVLPLKFGGEDRLARLLSFLPGSRLNDALPYSRSALERVGALCGRLGQVLAELDPEPCRRHLDWDLGHVTELEPHLEDIEELATRREVGRALAAFRVEALPRLAELPEALIHGDLNDWNLLDDGAELGVIDFGDLVVSRRIFDLAIAAAYAMFGQPDPQAALAAVVAGCAEHQQISDLELEVLMTAIPARWCMTLIMSARRRAAGDEDGYSAVSEDLARETLLAWARLGPADALDKARAACGRTIRPRGRSSAELVARRRVILGRSLSTSYAEPLKIVRGRGSWLFDVEGRAYLDGVNNVSHVGHSHPRVVAAAARQMATLNTNTRYLHDGIVDYAERLVASLPDRLSVVHLVCSGSEANELALRMARTATGRDDVVVLDGAYHGNTAGLIDVSPYKFDGAGGSGCPPTTRVVPAPDGYRGRHRRGDGDLAALYSGYVADSVARLGPPAAFLCESIQGCGGQIVLPAGFLAAAYAATPGAVHIADEVQVGFGRTGDDFWAFSAHGVCPDIVTMGKPIGNGHPLAAVVTTAEIAERFAGGMEYFNTFGGNPVSAAIGLAVLDVIRDERLQESARAVGSWLKQELEALAGRHPVIGDVRGAGLFLGVELTADQESRAPAASAAAAVVEGLRRLGVLLSVDGPAHNVLKFKPPMVFGRSEGTILLTALDEVMTGLSL